MSVAAEKNLRETRAFWVVRIDVSGERYGR
jgi:hypothetical protein